MHDAVRAGMVAAILNLHVDTRPETGTHPEGIGSACVERMGEIQAVDDENAWID